MAPTVGDLSGTTHGEIYASFSDERLRYPAHGFTLQEKPDPREAGPKRSRAQEKPDRAGPIVPLGPPQEIPQAAFLVPSVMRFNTGLL